MKLNQLQKWIQSNVKSIVLVLSVIVSLMSTQTACGQSTSRITKKYVDTICISKGLADTIIHDLKERKLLLIQNAALDAQRQILNKEVSALSSQVDVLTDDRNKWKKKARIRGWQRNWTSIGLIVLGIVLIK